MWWETCILVALYVLYWILMFQNERIMKFVKNIVENKLMWCQRIKNYDIANQCPYDENPATPATTITHVETPPIDAKPYGINNAAFTVSETDLTRTYSETYRKRRESADIIEARRTRRDSTDLSVIYAEEEDEEFKIWQLPRGASVFDQFWFFFTWPIRFSLHYTIPNPIKYKQWFALSFIMCIVWIGCTSYMVFWMVVIVGDTFGIPDPIMALTFLAFGGCMPEAISAVIVARKGSGQMGVSNALGANCLAVLFSLGLPWFIRTMVDGAGWSGAYIRIYSYGIEYTIMAIILAVITLYIVVAAAGYKLRRRMGGILGFAYLIFAAFAILVELEILFEPTERC
jgi:sodium/potassium/calcium exchanger 4